MPRRLPGIRIFAYFISKIISWKVQRFAILVTVDTLLVLMSFWIAFVLRFDDLYFSYYRPNFEKALPLALVSYLAVFIFGGMYRQVWRFANYQNAILIGKVCLLGSLIFLMLKYLYIPQKVLPRSIFVLHMLLSFLSVSGVRFAWRIFSTWKNKNKIATAKKACIIYGAGSAGEMLARYARSNPQFTFNIRGFVDDDLQKKGRNIQGSKILGSGDDLPKIGKKLGVATVIIAIPTLSGKRLRKISFSCQQANLKTLIMPTIEDSLGEKIIKLRKINETDLLKRVPKPTEKELIHKYFLNRSIMVTGGGGSIGSEICDQIVKARPKRIIIFDSCEYNLYSIEQKIQKIDQPIEIITVLGTVTSRELVVKTIKKYKPTVILHAAAYKHVPIVEQNASEGIRNNVEGTYELARAAAKYEVEKFVLISTDKAVQSSNVMGHSKRCCEMLIQAMQKSQEGFCSFSAVRFGNVLGSSGSVIPLFLKQIESGGPVTVTDKEVTRFFMLTEEAVCLVLQTVVQSDGGEIFVLDMGEPVKIYDMAKQLIHLNGKRPFDDIDIDIIGLRAGEKLHEELIIKGAEKTKLHSNVYITSPLNHTSPNLIEEIKKLIAFSKSYDDRITVEKLLEITGGQSQAQQPLPPRLALSHSESSNNLQ